MVVPALLYLAVNAGGAGSRGWAIPMATDIAFAVVVLAVLGARVPKPLKLFLLTLAIVDDIGAIVVIAVFYSDGIAFAWLLGALAVIVFILCMQRLGIGHSDHVRRARRGPVGVHVGVGSARDDRRRRAGPADSGATARRP